MFLKSRLFGTFVLIAMFKTKISHWLRKAGLLYGFDKANYLFNKLKFRAKNKNFIRENPSLKLPPPYVLYETYRMDYRQYFEDGRNTAEDIVKKLSDCIPLEKKSILDWGCGPARVVRHLPDLLPDSNIYASDYNEEIVAWCQKNIEDVHFSKNELYPPLPFDENSFDAVYALSVFTHLSAQNHFEWMTELHRIIKSGGIFLFTTQGNAFLNKLTAEEKGQFSKEQLIVRGKVKEGHRTYSAFQPEPFMYSLFSDQWKVLKFIPGTMKDWGPEQDTWIIQKI